MLRTTQHWLYAIHKSTQEINVKEAIKKMLGDGKNYDDIIQSVTEEAISQVLVKTRGNQTEAAEKLGMNRGTFRKYLTRMGCK